MARKLAVTLDAATLSVAAGQSRRRARARSRSREKDGRRDAQEDADACAWAVFAEITCAGETKRSPIVKATAKTQRAKSPARLAIFRPRAGSLQSEPGAKITLRIDWQGWCASFSRWSRSGHLTVTLFARAEFDRHIHRATTHLALSNVRTTMGTALHALVGERCEARLKVGLGALLPDAVRDIEMRAPADDFSLPHFEGFGPNDEESGSESGRDSVDSRSTRSSHSANRSQASEASSDEGRAPPDTSALLRRVADQIQAKCVDNGWASLLTGPLDGRGEKHVTFSRKQVKRILVDLGVSCSRREWTLLQRHFDPENSNAVPFRRLKAFLDRVETNNTALVSAPGSPAFSPRSRARARFSPGQRVEAQFLSGQTWLPGVVERVHPDGKLFEIKYDDGSFERLGLADERPLEEADWSHTLREALALVRRGIRAAKIAAAKHGQAVFSFPSLLEDFADIPTRPGRISFASLQEALRTARIRQLERQHFDELCAVLDPSGAGSANWKLFVELLERGDGRGGSSPSQKGIIQGVDEVLLRLEKALRRAKARRLRAVDAFALFSAPECSLVSLRDAAKACALLGCTMTDPEVAALDQRVRLAAPNTPPGQLDYVELLRLVNAGEGATGVAANRLSQLASYRDPATDAPEALQRVRKQLLELADARQEAVNIRGSFEEVDRAGDGTVTFPQFISTVRKLGLVVAMEDLRAIAAVCAPTRGDLEGPVHERYGALVDYGKFEALMHAEDVLGRAIQAQLRGAAARGISAWAAFRALDRRDLGEVSRVDFRRTCLRTLGLRLRESELRRLMDRFQKRRAADSTAGRGARRVDYVAFLDFVAPHGEAGTIEDHDLSGLEASIRNSIRAAALLHESGPALDLQSVFACFDTAGRQYCSQAEFFAGLDRLGLQFTASERKSLLAKFDPRASDQVDYAAFVRYAGFSELEMDQLAARVLRRLREVQAEGTDALDVFSVFDVAGDDRISRREFREAARVLGMPVTEVEVEVLAKKFAQFDNPDLVHYKDFLRWAAQRQDRATSRENAEFLIDQERLLRHRAQRQRASRSPRKGRHRRHGSSAGSEEDAAEDSRAVVNGSGYDGFGGIQRAQTVAQMLTPRALTSVDRRKADAKVNVWLQSEATPKERAQYLGLQASIDDFAAKTNAKALRTAVLQQEPDVFYDHAAATVHRVVDHAESARLRERAQARFAATLRSHTDRFVPHQRADSALATSTALYTPDTDWQNQWQQTRPGEAFDNDALRAIIADAFTDPDDRRGRRHRGRPKRSSGDGSKKTKRKTGKKTSRSRSKSRKAPRSPHRRSRAHSRSRAQRDGSRSPRWRDGSDEESDTSSASSTSPSSSSSSSSTSSASRDRGWRNADSDSESEDDAYVRRKRREREQRQREARSPRSSRSPRKSPTRRGRSPLPPRSPRSPRSAAARRRSYDPIAEDRIFSNTRSSNGRKK